MSFIIQEIPQPTVFGLGTVEPTTGAGGTINFYAGEQDLLVLEGNASSDWILNVEFDPTTSLDVAMQDDDVLTIEYAAKNGATPYRQTEFRIDGTKDGIDLSWTGTLPSAGTANKVDYYKYQIIKTFDASFTVIGTFTPGGNEFGTVPSEPLGVSAAAVNGSAINVTFSAPSSTGGYPILNYEVTSNPSAITATGSASPIQVVGLTSGTPYTFTVEAVNIIGNSDPSLASNTATPAPPPGQIAFVSAGTYSWIAPAGITQVSVVAVGAGGNATGSSFAATGGAGGGGLGYKNNIAVIPGNSYTVVVGDRTGSSTKDSYFIDALTVKGGGGSPGNSGSPIGAGGNYVGDGGGNGGPAGPGSGSPGRPSGSGGAGGYAGTGGTGGQWNTNDATAGTGGAGGGGGTYTEGNNPIPAGAGAGGGVGLLGQGPNGAKGNLDGPGNAVHGGGGSGGTQASFSPVVYPSSGGGGGGSATTGEGGVRIIWAGGTGITRAFPSTNTGDL